MKGLLDTNAYRDLRVGDAAVHSHVMRYEALIMSVVVIGELLYGFRHGTRYTRNRAELDEFLTDPHVTLVPVNLATAERYALVAAALRRKGRPIPTNDMWIAAHALEHGADLISSDDHFGEIDGLSWIKPE